MSSVPPQLSPLVEEVDALEGVVADSQRSLNLARGALGVRLLEFRAAVGAAAWRTWLASRPQDDREVFAKAMVVGRRMRERARPSSALDPF